MRYVYPFYLKNIVNIDNYYIFLEIFLKQNNILKKDFFTKTGICPNSYRFFLKNKEKNKYSYYKLISKEYNLYLASDDELCELSRQYSEIFEDILYHRTEKLTADTEMIEAVRKRNNPENEPGIFSIEGILFELLSSLLNISLNTLNERACLENLTQLLEKIMPYRELLTEEYELILYLLQIYDKGLKKEKMECEIFSASEAMGKYHVFYPLMNRIIADAYYHAGDYMNSAVFGVKAYEGFVSTDNFKQAVSAKIHYGTCHILSGSYFSAYEALYSLSLSSDSYSEAEKNRILRGMTEALILLEKYGEAYELIRENPYLLESGEGKTEYLAVLYKMNKKEAFKQLYSELEQAWKEGSLPNEYHTIHRYIQMIYNTPKMAVKRIESLKEAIRSLPNPMIIKVCKFIFKLN